MRDKQAQQPHVAIATMALYALILLVSWVGLIHSESEISLYANSALQHPYYYPPLFSVWLAEQLTWLFGPAGSAFLGVVVFPVASFVLLFGIFNRHIDSGWALVLSLLALSAFDHYPFRQFLAELISLQLNFKGESMLPIISGFPVPSFSMLYFLAVFRLATSSWLANPQLSRTSVITVLFSSLAYINAIDLIFAVAFWASYIPMRWIRRRWNLVKICVSVSGQAALGGVIIAPALLIGHIDPNLPAPGGVDVYSVAIYIVAPLFLTVGLVLIRRVDPAELLFSFRHVYVLMFAEVFIWIIATSSVVPLNLEIFSNRAPQFFVHVYYYMPVIYLASKGSTPYGFGVESHWISVRIATIARSVFTDWRRYLTAGLLILLLAYNLTAVLGPHI